MPETEYVNPSDLASECTWEGMFHAEARNCRELRDQLSHMEKDCAILFNALQKIIDAPLCSKEQAEAYNSARYRGAFDLRTVRWHMEERQPK